VYRPENNDPVSAGYVADGVRVRALRGVDLSIPRGDCG
jgi:hypothetical protein